MARVLACAGVLLAAWLASLGIAEAQTQRPAAPLCGTRAQAISLLSKRYGEVPVWRGLSHSGGLVEVFFDLADGSWTLVAAQPGGPTCIFIFGTGGQFVPTPPKPPSGPARPA